MCTWQAEAFEKQGKRALQAPLHTKPRLYDNLLEASRTLPVSGVQSCESSSVVGTRNTEVTIDVLPAQEKPEIPNGVLEGVFVELRPLEVEAEGSGGEVVEKLFETSDGSAR